MQLVAEKCMEVRAYDNDLPAPQLDSDFRQETSQLVGRISLPILYLPYFFSVASMNA